VGILLWILIYILGMLVGFLLKTFLYRITSYTGVIHIYDGEEKTVYSLELNEYPEEIRFKKEVVFKVDAPEEKLNRD